MITNRQFRSGSVVELIAKGCAGAKADRAGLSVRFTALLHDAAPDSGRGVGRYPVVKCTGYTNKMGAHPPEMALWEIIRQIDL
jgi:hypothetical protein